MNFPGKAEPNHRPGWLRWWWPALLMMTVIFFASTDLGAMSHQSRLLGPFLRWLGFSDVTANNLIAFVRKNGHAVGYASLAICLWRGWTRRTVFWNIGAWSLRLAGVPLVLAALYACSDEWHQSFVPSRTAAVSDVVLDTAGAALGLLALWTWHHTRRAKRS